MSNRDAAAVPATSSEPSKLPPEQHLLFQEILTLLEERKVNFVVAGAFALRAHTGIARDTKDLDLFLTSREVAAAMKLLKAEGFECEICDPVWLYKAHRDGFYVDLITGMSNAAFIVEDSWIARAQPAVVHGVHTRVLAAEELLLSKLFVTRRERFDGADIAHIIYGTQGKLDWPRILHATGANWEVLLWALVLFRYCYPAQTYFVPKEVWKELTTRFEEVLNHPDPGAEFRGSLIDENMFAIDVKEWGLDDLMRANRERRLQSLPRDAGIA